MPRVENYKFKALNENYELKTYNTANVYSNALVLTRKPEIDIYWLYCCLPGLGFVWVTHWKIYTCKEFAEYMQAYIKEYNRYPEMIFGHKIKEGK